MTNKDLLFLGYILLWFIGGFICVMLKLNITIYNIVMICIMGILVLARNRHSFERWLNIRKSYYKLTDDERAIWRNIIIKANKGYNEWYDETHGDDLCGPWIADINPKEVALLDKIHEMFYGNDWWVALPMSVAQVCYVEFEDIKNKVR